jgi:hypothetical protein
VDGNYDRAAVEELLGVLARHTGVSAEEQGAFTAEEHGAFTAEEHGAFTAEEHGAFAAEAIG